MKYVNINYTIGIFILFITVNVFVSCSKRDCLSSSGSQKTESRSLEIFKKIEIYNYFNVYLKSDTVNKIEIEAGENLISNIETLVSDGVLTIKDLNACGFIKGYKSKNLYISVDTLSEVVIHDGTNLYSKDTLNFHTLTVKYLSQIGYCDLTLDCYSFQLQVWYASGDYILRGKTGYLYLDAEYLAFVYAEGIDANDCYVYNNSMGDCFVKTYGQLKVQIKDSGNIYYSGKPSEIIVEERSGTGKLIKKE